VQDTPSPLTPDSIFPNNWISVHEGGTMVLYPMYARNRRQERKQTVIDALKQNAVINEVQYNLTSENSHIIYIVYTIDKSNVIYPVVEQPEVKQTPKTNKKKDKTIMSEFELKNEQYAHLKFKKDDADVLYITTKEKNNFVSVDEIEERVNRFRSVVPAEALDQYLEYIDNLVLDVQTELDNKTTKSI
jgi:hypothetical protein